VTAKKDPAAKSIAVNVTFRPDQEIAVRRLQAARKLSTVCQGAVDGEIEKYLY
jgi:hypothetical protein